MAGCGSSPNSDASVVTTVSAFFFFFSVSVLGIKTSTLACKHAM